MKKLLVILMILMVGCLGPKKVTEEKNDVVAIEKVLLLPKPPLYAGSTFSLTFSLSNIMVGPGASKVSIVDLKCYDWGRCKPVNDCASGIKKPIELFPGGAELVEWSFSAPTREELGGLSVTCPIRFKATYPFEAVTISEIAIIDEQRLREVQRSGGDVSIGTSENRGPGPLKITFEYSFPQPLRTSNNITLTLKVKDNGNGIYQMIPQGALSLTVPKELKTFKCDRMEPKAGAFVSSVNLTMIGRESTPVRCTFTTPDKVDELESFFLEGRLGYSYEVHRQEEVKLRTSKE